MYYELIAFTGIAVIVASISVSILILAKTLLFSLPAVIYRGAQFVQSDDSKIVKMIELAQLHGTERVVDIGSGDGKLIIKLAKNGVAADGVEINPYLVRVSRKRIKESGLEHLAKIHQSSLWNFDTGNYDAVFVYGTGLIMDRLAEKLQRELKPGARVISNHFKLPGWEVEKEESGVLVYVQKNG
jgi:SAM-dependent methyltransferase